MKTFISSKTLFAHVTAAEKGAKTVAADLLADLAVIADDARVMTKTPRAVKKAKDAATRAANEKVAAKESHMPEVYMHAAVVRAGMGGTNGTLKEYAACLIQFATLSQSLRAVVIASLAGLPFYSIIAKVRASVREVSPATARGTKKTAKVAQPAPVKAAKSEAAKVQEYATWKNALDALIKQWHDKLPKEVEDILIKATFYRAK